MKNMMTREQMMGYCRSAVSAVAGVDSRTKRDVAEMTMRTNGAAREMREDVVSSLMNEMEAASEDFSF